MGENLTPLPSPREASAYTPNSVNMTGANLRQDAIAGSAIGTPITGGPQGQSSASGAGSAAVHFGGRLPLPHVQYADDDGSEPRVDTRKGKERVMRQCSCGHYNHIRKNNCEKCDLPKPPPRKREKRPRRKKRQYLSTANMGPFSQSFTGPFGSYGSHHQQYMQTHLQSPIQQQNVPSQHNQFGQSQTPSYLPQITSLAQHRAQHSELEIDRQEGPSGIIQEPEPSNIFRRNAQEYTPHSDNSAVPVLNTVHTTHSLGGTVGPPAFGREETGPASTGFALTHGADMHPSGHMLGPTAGNAGNDGHSRSVSPNMGGRSQPLSQEQSGHSIFHRMQHHALSMDDVHHRSGHDQLRPSGLAHTILSTPAPNSNNGGNRDVALGMPVETRGSLAHGQGHSPMFTHGHTQNRYPFSTQVQGGGGTSDGSHGLAADMQSFQHISSLSAVVEPQRLGAGNPRHDSRADADSSHGGRHSR